MGFKVCKKYWQQEKVLIEASCYTGDDVRVLTNSGRRWTEAALCHCRKESRFQPTEMVDERNETDLAGVYVGIAGS